jgi:hypothetical protein
MTQLLIPVSMSMRQCHTVLAYMLTALQETRISDPSHPQIKNRSIYLKLYHKNTQLPDTVAETITGATVLDTVQS